MSETLLEALTDIRQRLKKDEYRNEEHVRFSLVGRVLAALGWDLWNPTEVNTEEKPHEGENHTKVDVSLRVSGKKTATIYLECKRVGMLIPHLPKVEEQVLNYNSKNAASLVVLTDGRYWRFYYALGQAAFRERLFADYDLLEPNLSEVSQTLNEVLDRSRVAEGTAKTAAEERWDMQQLAVRMKELLEPAKESAHQNLRSWPEEFRELLRQRGVSITVEEAIEFIKSNGTKLPKAQVETGVVPNFNLYTAKSLPGPISPEVVDISATPRFKMKGRGGNAIGCLLPDGRMQVLARATAAGTVSNAFAKQKLRAQLQDNGVLQMQGEALIFTQDYTFNTPNAAADIVYGNPVNALIMWRHETTNETLKNFLAQNQSKG